MIVELDFLKRALNNEERALHSATSAYNHYKDSGDSKMADALKVIMEDEVRHVSMIKDMIEKKESNKFS